MSKDDRTYWGIITVIIMMVLLIAGLSEAVEMAKREKASKIWMAQNYNLCKYEDCDNDKILDGYCYDHYIQKEKEEELANAQKDTSGGNLHEGGFYTSDYQAGSNSTNNNTWSMPKPSHQSTYHSSSKNKSSTSSGSKYSSSTYSGSKSNYSKSKSYTSKEFDPVDYDDPEEYADDAWGVDFDDWDDAYEYWEDNY